MDLRDVLPDTNENELHFTFPSCLWGSLLYTDASLYTTVNEDDRGYGKPGTEPRIIKNEIVQDR